MGCTSSAALPVDTEGQDLGQKSNESIESRLIEHMSDYHKMRLRLVSKKFKDAVDSSFQERKTLEWTNPGCRAKYAQRILKIYPDIQHISSLYFPTDEFDVPPTVAADLYPVATSSIESQHPQHPLLSCTYLDSDLDSDEEDEEEAELDVLDICEGKKTSFVILQRPKFDSFSAKLFGQHVSLCGAEWLQLTITTTDFMSNFFRGLENKHTLKSITLMSFGEMNTCFLDSNSGKVFGQALVGSKVETLILSGLCFTMDFFTELSKYLKYHHLRSISLLNCQSAGNGIINVLDSLVNNTKIENLVLSGTPLTKDGFNALMEMLPMCPMLKALDISSTGLADTDIGQEFAALTNCNLNELAMRDNPFSDDGLRRIHSTMIENKNLQIVQLPDDLANSIFAQKIRGVTKRNNECASD
ncbi:hypothetical protein PCE1_000761 [Barthelona sp. PCE]